MGLNSNKKFALQIAMGFVGTSLAAFSISKYKKNNTSPDSSTHRNTLFNLRPQKSEHEDQEVEQKRSKPPKKAFDKDGFDENGWDYLGYGRNGYNADGIDRAGKTSHDYSSDFMSLQSTMDKAFEQLKRREFTYALHDARRVLEETLKQYVRHYLGEANLGNSIKQNIEICKWRKLLSEDFTKRLHKARKLCNTEHHDFDAQFDKKSVDDVLGLVQEFLERVTDELVYA